MANFNEKIHGSVGTWPLAVLGHQHLVIEPFECQTFTKQDPVDEDRDDQIWSKILIFGLKLAFCITQLYTIFSAVD